MAYNKVILMGRLTADPEIKATSTGVEYCDFSVACDRRYVKDGEERKADFIICKAWRATASFIGKYFKKGSMIHIDGALTVDKYVDKDGNNRNFTFVSVDNVDFCGGKSDGSTQSSSAPAPATAPAPNIDVVTDGTEDDLPF